MRKLLNTLYVTTQGAYLARDGEAIAVRVERETRLHVPVHTLSGLICFGQVSVSPGAMELCSQHGVAVSFLTERGRFQARVQGPVSGNVLLRREQYRRADDGDGAAVIARSVVAGKVTNCRTVLLRAVRDHPGAAGRQAVEEAAAEMARSLNRLESELPLDTVRGIEGDAANCYFAVFDHLLVAQKDAFSFSTRTRRPPMDSINALLSFVYTLLVHDIAGALESVGLDPAVGFLHRDRPGRPSLALDLMEEFRPVLADRLVLSLVNRSQVRPTGFVRSETGAVSMDDDTRKEVVVAWQKRKQEEIQHPFLGEKISFGLVPFVQALLLARHLRGDIDLYPPFVWR